MRTFYPKTQVDRLIASGIGRLQGIADEDYRCLWPLAINLPEQHEGRFEHMLLVDAFPLHPIPSPIDYGTRRVTRPCRYLPLPDSETPQMMMFEKADELTLCPTVHPQHGELLRYIVFWQPGTRWPGTSANTARAKFAADECGLRLIEGLHLALQEPALVRARKLPLCDVVDEHGQTHFVHWMYGPTPLFSTAFGMFTEEEGVPSRAKEVVPVSTEDTNFFYKG
ncbi:MAG: hypothetical protein WC866_04520 [Patescibacteria group bacterium]|jgi:hypothetical protein